MAFLIWASVVWGVTMIVTLSRLFAGFRERFPSAHGVPLTLGTMLGTLLRCPMCFGWWVGAFFALVGYSPVVLEGSFLPSLLRHPLAIIASGSAASAICWTWHVALERLGSSKL